MKILILHKSTEKASALDVERILAVRFGNYFRVSRRGVNFRGHHGSLIKRRLRTADLAIFLLDRGSIEAGSLEMMAVELLAARALETPVLIVLVDTAGDAPCLVDRGWLSVLISTRGVATEVVEWIRIYSVSQMVLSATDGSTDKHINRRLDSEQCGDGFARNKGIVLAQVVREVTDVLAKVAHDSEGAKTLAKRAGFPPEYLPEFKVPIGFWNDVVEQAAHGRMELRALVGEAAKQFPYNSELRKYNERLIERLAPMSECDKAQSAPESETPLQNQCPDSSIRSIWAPLHLHSTQEIFVVSTISQDVSPGEAISVKLAIFVEAHRNPAMDSVHQQRPAGQTIVSQRCRWQVGTSITVVVKWGEYSNMCIQQLEWCGAWNVASFELGVSATEHSEMISVSIGVVVEGVRLIEIREFVRIRPIGGGESQITHMEVRVPQSAFASYSRPDRVDVLGRLRSLRSATGIDVFIDCLSMNPSEQWKIKVRREIMRRDTFFLFWSRSAKNSKWVDWEWRQALATKGLLGIQAHPLDSTVEAPPPLELEALRFDAAYESSNRMRSSWIRRHVRRWLQLG